MIVYECSFRFKSDHILIIFIVRSFTKQFEIINPYFNQSITWELKEMNVKSNIWKNNYINYTLDNLYIVRVRELSHCYKWRDETYKVVTYIRIVNWLPFPQWETEKNSFHMTLLACDKLFHTSLTIYEHYFIYRLACLL